MRFKNKVKQILMISISVMLFIGTIVVCIFGQIRYNEQKYKKYSGAKEVNSYYIDYNGYLENILKDKRNGTD